MASPVNALICAVIATAFWSLVGYALGCRLVPRVLAIGAAPVIGWSVHSAATLPIHLLFGFSPLLVVGIAAVCILVAGFSLSQPRQAEETEPAHSIPGWAFAAAAFVALVPALTILPKSSGGAVWLADATFDHAKVAIIDAMVRLGLPPVNPVIGEGGALSGLAYYYLWHFSGAEIALVTTRSGWEADVGLTWFTAFASLNLMMGLAAWLSKRGTAAIFALALAAAGSLWVPLYWVFQAKSLAPVLRPPIGMGGWLFQATWAPQHLMAASCVVAAMLLVTRYALSQSLALVVTIALVIVAGFESSAFVGGVAFAVAGLIAAPILIGEVHPPRRLRFVGGTRHRSSAGRLPDCAFCARPIGGNCEPRRRRALCNFALSFVRRSVSGLAAPGAGRSGLLAHRTACRAAGDLHRRRDRVCRSATQRDA